MGTIATLHWRGGLPRERAGEPGSQRGVGIGHWLRDGLSGPFLVL